MSSRLVKRDTNYSEATVQAFTASASEETDKLFTSGGSVGSLSLEVELLMAEELKATIPLKITTTKRRSKRKSLKVKRENFSGKAARCNLAYPRWCPKEDIFLHGIVLDTYGRRHSLKPFLKDSKQKKSVHGETVVWNQVHNRYKIACRRYEALTGEVLGERTVRAIQKRWKQGDHSNPDDLAMDETGSYISHMPSYKKYQREWDYKYNADDLLTCSEKRFREYYDSNMISLFDDIPETM